MSVFAQSMQDFESRLARSCPLRADLGGSSEAAVAILLTRMTATSEPLLVLTKRAAHLRAHAGEVAFPGGKWEEGDRDLAATALRETWEEINQPVEGVELIAMLPRCHTRQGVAVTPFVGWIESLQGLAPNADELDSVFAVPLSYLLQDPRIRTDVFIYDFGGEKIERRIPVYQYADFTIWGFTAAVIVGFLNRAFDAAIDMDVVRADERIFNA